MKFLSMIQPNLSCIWLGKSVPSVIIDKEATEINHEKLINALADVIAIHDPAFVKIFCDRFLVSLS